MKYRIDVEHICKGNYKTSLSELILEMEGKAIEVYNKMIQQVINTVKNDGHHDQIDINSITNASLYAIKSNEKGLWPEENKILEVDYQKHRITSRNLGLLIKNFQIKI